MRTTHCDEELGVPYPGREFARVQRLGDAQRLCGLASLSFATKRRRRHRMFGGGRNFDRREQSASRVAIWAASSRRRRASPPASVSKTWSVNAPTPPFRARRGCAHRASAGRPRGQRCQRVRQRSGTRFRGYRADIESCCRTAWAAVTRASMGKFLFASMTMPIRSSGTKAAYAPNPAVEPVLLNRVGREGDRGVRDVAGLGFIAAMELPASSRSRSVVTVPLSSMSCGPTSTPH